MKHAKLIGSLLLGGTVVMAWQFPASAQMRTSRGGYQSTAATGTGNLLGIGLKAGNGIGFTGLDVILNPAPNLSLDLQAGLTQAGTFGLAPAIQFHMDPAGGPYAGVGLSYTPETTGVFGNVGWQLKPVSNVGILLGIGYLQALQGTGGGLNYEVGVRYFFM